MTTKSKGLTVQAYAGDGSILLAFDVDDKQTAGLAGFAIECTTPSGKSYVLPNRLSFSTPTVNAAQPALTPTTKAPIQKFRWLDVLSNPEIGTYKYQVTAMYFDGGTKLKAGGVSTVSVKRTESLYSNLDIGFTRGYISSQAYVDKFKNAPIGPATPTIDFDTKPYAARYQWLGYHARQQIFDFLGEAKTSAYSIDAFVYDFDEPDVVRALQKLGPRLRIIMDDSSSHVGAAALEPKAQALLAASAGAANVKTGHFKRYAHDKIFILKKNGKPVKVLTGSANFSVRGLYVQANNVLVFNDAATAVLYETAFEQAFTEMAHFSSAPIAKQWWDRKGKGLPSFSVSFAPHTSSALSLDRVTNAIGAAKSSVLFAVMDLSGSGPVLTSLKNIPNNSVFSYGMTQRDSGLDITNPNSNEHRIVPFAYLNSQVPPPFQKEWSGGTGEVIHHKFVVVDFNGAKPLVYTGSSNLAAGGETENGDNLIEIAGGPAATLYAVEAIRLIDHFHFRYTVNASKSTTPLVLSTGDWWKSAYLANSFQANDRHLFAKT